MKRGWIALVMIALSLLFGGIEYLYVTANADAYLQMLEEADEKMADNKTYEAASVARRLDNRFQKQSGVFNIFMYHSEIGHIASDLAMLEKYAQAGATGDFLATSACARRKLLMIRSAKLIRWENIF